jgi:hypothetical protein
MAAVMRRKSDVRKPRFSKVRPPLTNSLLFDTILQKGILSKIARRHRARQIHSTGCVTDHCRLPRVRFERTEDSVMPFSSIADVFILSAFDRDQWCPVLQARFRVDDLEALRSILGEQANDDPELRHEYLLDDDELSAVVRRFAVLFDPTKLPFERPEISLFRKHSISDAPYLIHTWYELPLLLDGRKKLARMSHEYPPETFEGEDRFDHWVSGGVLSKAEVSEPFRKQIKGYLGIRTVYYTPVGEEWRIPAMQMIMKASGKSGGWNEHFERLEGMLFGYSDAENDWWINVGLKGGGFGGVAICCAVGSEGLAWMEAAGFRALPPSDKPTVKMRSYRGQSEIELQEFFFQESGAEALIRFNVGFNVLGRHMMNMADLRTAGPWDVPSDQIPILNRHLRGLVVVVARRVPPVGSNGTPAP